VPGTFATADRLHEQHQDEQAEAQRDKAHDDKADGLE